MSKKQKQTKQAHIYFNEREFRQLDELQRISEKYLTVAPSKAEMFRLALNFLFMEQQKNPELIKEILKADIRED